MNLKAIAELAGVSVSSVSKAFSGSREVSQKTKERIFEIARENGCFDRYNKNKFDKKVVAVIVPEVNSDHYYHILLDLDREITKRGGIMLSSVSNFSEKKTAELFRYYAEYCKADGVIIVGSAGKIQNPFLLPAVALGIDQKIKNVNSIYTNIQSAMDEAIVKLRNLGHVKIGFIGENLTKTKLEHFHSAMAKAGAVINPDYIKVSNKRFEEAGAKLAEEMLATDSLPTAVIAAYDYIAIGFMKALQCRGVRVPEDVSVIGMDDIRIAKYLEPSLSSIHYNNSRACALATDMIFKKMKNQYSLLGEDNIEIEAKLILRESVGPSKK